LNKLHQRMLLHAIRLLVQRGAIKVIQDDFAPEFLIWSIKGMPQLVEIEPSIQTIVDKTNLLGGYNNSSFLFEALRGFEAKHRLEATRYLDELEKKFQQAEGDDEQPVANTEDVIDAEEDTWSPLQIDRESAEAKDAIQKSEGALKEIEQSNGYASSDMEERNGIVTSIKGALDSIKLGSPSRQFIVAGLLAPLKFIAKKFSEASMGEAAKIAVAALVKWLF
jgi:hypothetical protein